MMHPGLKTLALLFCSLCIIGLILIAGQHYLAKYKNGSLLYWRNSPLLINTLFKIARHSYIEHAVLVAKVFFSSDQKIRIIFKIRYTHLFRLKKLFEKIDDIIDSMPAATLLLLQRSEPTSFEDSILKKILNEEDWRFIQLLINNGSMTEKELSTFFNIILNKLYLQAVLTYKYQHQSKSKEKARLRLQIAQENIETTGTYYIFIAHFIKKDKRVLDLITQAGNNELTYKRLKKIYPEARLVGELEQIKHDTIEHRHDLQQELLVGKISPNYFLARLEKNGQLVDGQKELIHLPNRPATYYELPSMIQHNYLALRKYFMKRTLKMGILTRIIFILSWEYQYRIGFYTTKPRSWKKRNRS